MYWKPLARTLKGLFKVYVFLCVLLVCFRLVFQTYLKLYVAISEGKLKLIILKNHVSVFLYLLLQMPHRIMKSKHHNPKEKRILC